MQKGQALKLSETEARRKFGRKLVVASLGAQWISGAKESGDLVVRLLSSTARTASPLKAAYESGSKTKGQQLRTSNGVRKQLATQPGRKFGFKVNVKDVHRLTPVSPEEWHLLACCSGKRQACVLEQDRHARGGQRRHTGGAELRLQPSGGLITSWVTNCQRGCSWWQMTWQCCSTTARCGNQCSWFSYTCKCRGLSALLEKSSPGEKFLQWVGYELLLSEASLGLSSSRAQWLEGWYTRLSRDRSVQMQEFQEELGRAAFVCGALDYDRPFLAPLCVFAARHAPASVKPHPLYVLVSLEYLRQKIRQRRHCECGLSRRSWSESTHTLTNTVWELVDGGPARINMASSPLLRRSIPGDCLTGTA